MVSRIRRKLDSLHIQQINGEGKKGAGEDNRQKKLQSGFILEIAFEILATNDTKKYEVDNVYTKTNFWRRKPEQGGFLHAKNRQGITRQSNKGQRDPIIFVVDISTPFFFGRGLPLDHQGDDPGEDQENSEELYEMKLAVKENHRKDGHRENAGVSYRS